MVIWDYSLSPKSVCGARYKNEEIPWKSQPTRDRISLAVTVVEVWSVTYGPRAKNARALFDPSKK